MEDQSSVSRSVTRPAANSSEKKPEPPEPDGFHSGLPRLHEAIRTFHLSVCVDISYRILSMFSFVARLPEFIPPESSSGSNGNLQISMTKPHSSVLQVPLVVTHPGVSAFDSSPWRTQLHSGPFGGLTPQCNPSLLISWIRSFQVLID